MGISLLHFGRKDRRVSKDISKTLEGWEYDPDQISVRIVTGDDGRDKIQMRLDLGLLQMEFDGRPDGKTRRPAAARWLEFYERQQRQHDAEDSDGEPFLLESEDCQRLLREGVQYYHRYVSFWHLERYELCARDTNRNLRLFAFVRQYARHHKDKLQFDQWRPYVTMMHARAVATPLVEMRDYRGGAGRDRRGDRRHSRFSARIRPVAKCRELQRAVVSAAMARGNRGQDEVRRPRRRTVRSAGHGCKPSWNEAVGEERFEDAARLRDTIRQHTSPRRRNQPAVDGRPGVRPPVCELS